MAARTATTLGTPANPMSQIRAAEPVAINLSFFLIPHGNHPPSPVQHPINEADDSLLGTQVAPVDAQAPLAARNATRYSQSHEDQTQGTAGTP